MISERLRFAVKTSPYPQYKLAHAINVPPSTLSCWLNGISPVPDGDPRVIRLGEILQIPERECFDRSCEGSRETQPGTIAAALLGAPRICGAFPIPLNDERRRRSGRTPRHGKRKRDRR
jgi:hypothetical protein